MTPIMASSGAILARPTGGVLATDCGDDGGGGPCEEVCCLGDYCDPAAYPDAVFPITGQAVSGAGCSYLYDCPGISGLSGSTIYQCQCHDRCFQVSWSPAGWSTSPLGGGPGGCGDQPVVDFVVELIPCP